MGCVWVLVLALKIHSRAETGLIHLWVCNGGGTWYLAQPQVCDSNDTWYLRQLWAGDGDSTQYLVQPQCVTVMAPGT